MKFIWQSLGSSFPSLQEHPLQVWFFSLNFSPEIYYRLFSLLDESEKQKAKNYSFERSRLAYVGLRGALRILLTRFLRLKNVEISITYNKNGKPFLKEENRESPLFFNGSHSQDLGILAFSPAKEVGVDLECKSPDRQIDFIVSKYFLEQEQKHVLSTTGEEKLSRFYRLWTAKEALLKAQGEGLWRSLEEVKFSLEDFFRDQLVSWETYSVFSLTPPDPRVEAALAVQGDIVSVLGIRSSLEEILQSQPSCL